MKYTRLFVVAILIIGMATLTISCNKENGISTCIVEDYSITVSNEPIVRATVDDDLKVNFQEGDRIWCEAKDSNGDIVGVGYLTLKGTSANNTIFSGQYAYKQGAIITEYNYMLLGANTEAYEIKTVANRSLPWVTPEVSKWPFPASNPLPAKICPDLNDAVERFGVFSCKVESERLPRTIILTQEKSFIKFNLLLNINTEVLPYHDVELTCMLTTTKRHMLPTYTAQTSGVDFSTLCMETNFVLPMDNTFSKAQIIIPREGNEAALAVKFGKEENNLAPGTVYSVQKVMTRNTLLVLEKDMPTGFIGSVNEDGDEKGIIVDLGKSGRIVVETKNVGSVRPEDPGQMCGWGDTQDLGDGWKALSNDMFNALFELNHSWVVRGGLGGVEFHFNLPGFTTSTTLFLPAAGYDVLGQIVERGIVGFYWTSTCTDWEQIDAYVMEFASAGHQLVSSPVRGTVYSVRRYHAIDDI